MSEKVRQLYIEGKSLHKFTPESIRIPIENAAKFALPFLKKGRQGYDVPHTANVDYFAIQIARDEHLDELVLRTSAWLHDVGYSIKKKDHNKYSLEIADQFFNKNHQYYTDEQINRILRIIDIHDNTAKIKEIDEIAFMESDAISAITTDTSKFNNSEQAMQYSNHILMPKIDKFQTIKGKELLRLHLDNFVGEILRVYLYNK